MKATQSQEHLRMGLIATDPLRILGLQAIFSEGGGAEVIPLSVPGALDASGVSLILIDGQHVSRSPSPYASDTLGPRSDHSLNVVIGSSTSPMTIQSKVRASAAKRRQQLEEVIRAEHRSGSATPPTHQALGDGQGNHLSPASLGKNRLQPKYAQWVRSNQAHTQCS